MARRRPERSQFPAPLSEDIMTPRNTGQGRRGTVVLRGRLRHGARQCEGVEKGRPAITHNQGGRLGFFLQFLKSPHSPKRTRPDLSRSASDSQFLAHKALYRRPRLEMLSPGCSGRRLPLVARQADIVYLIYVMCYWLLLLPRLLLLFLTSTIGHK